MKSGDSAAIRCFLASSALALMLAACGPADQGSASQPTTAVEMEPVSQSSLAAQATAEQQGPITLHLWLPPAFSTFSGDPSASLFQARLDLFHEQNPSVQIEIRLKEANGPGSLIESWANAAEAAPLALPDLVLLDSAQFEQAQGSGLLQPLSNLENSNLDSDWYPFGRQMVEIEGLRYGWPFAGDAMILMHRFSAIEDIPSRWDQVLAEPLVLAFAAADSQAAFAFQQYASLINPDAAGGQLEDLDTEHIVEFLNYANQGRSNGVFPFWLTQLESEAQSWEAYSQGRSAMVATWSRRFFLSPDTNQGAGPLPTADGSVHSHVHSWAWAVASQDSGRRALAISLAEFLSDAEFMAQWSAAAGYLPTRESALTAWAPSPKQALGLLIAPFAEPAPSTELSKELGAALSEALIGLLKDELSVLEANTLIQSRVANP